MIPKTFAPYQYGVILIKDLAQSGLKDWEWSIKTHTVVLSEEPEERHIHIWIVETRVEGVRYWVYTKGQSKPLTLHKFLTKREAEYYAQGIILAILHYL